MNANVGSIDRLFRVVLGLVLFSSYFWLQGSLRWIAVIGVVPLLTAVFRFCPLYSLLGMNTCPAGTKRA